MTTPVTVDTLTSTGASLQASGRVAEALLRNGFNVQSLRTNDVLRKEEWVHYDRTIVDVARARMASVGDLLARGLRYPLANALGTTVIEWERMSDMSPAQIDMSGVTPAERDRVAFDLTSIPVPITHKEFEINIRVLEASRRTGQPLDTTQAAISARKLSEMNEQVLFDGHVLGGGRSTVNQIYGFRTYPDRNVAALSFDWSAIGVDNYGEKLIRDILNLIAEAKKDYFYGPFQLYIPEEVFTLWGDDYKAGSDKSIMMRVLEIAGIESIMPTHHLSVSPDGSTAGTEVLLVQMSQDVVEMVDGMQPTPVQWDSMGGLKMHFKIMSILLPRFKSDMGDRCGIVHATSA